MIFFFVCLFQQKTASIPLTKAAQIKIKARLLRQRDVDEISQKAGARFVLYLKQIFFFFF